MNSKDAATQSNTARAPISPTDVERFTGHPKFLEYARIAQGDQRYAYWLHEVDKLLHKYFGMRHAEMSGNWRSMYDQGATPPAAAALGVSAA